MSALTTFLFALEGAIFLYLLYVLFTMNQYDEPKKKIKTAVKPETILAPDPESKAEPKPEPEPEPEPVPETVEEPVVEVSEPAPSSINIIDIEGIGPVYSEKLTSLGIRTTTDLLEAGATRRGREGLAETSGISPKLILEWVNLADLYRVKGVAEEYSDLLEEAGVDTVPELAQRNPANLHATLVEVNQAKNLVRRVPSPGMVEDWVEQAKSLPRKIEY